MVKVYYKEYGNVYEPAEGGYHVEVDNVSFAGSFDNAEQAFDFIENETGGHGHMSQYPSYDYATGRYDSDGAPLYESTEAIAIIEEGRDTGYIGEGSDWIVVEDGAPEPAGHSYIGYR